VLPSILGTAYAGLMPPVYSCSIRDLVGGHYRAAPSRHQSCAGDDAFGFHDPRACAASRSMIVGAGQELSASDRHLCRPLHPKMSLDTRTHGAPRGSGARAKAPSRVSPLRRQGTAPWPGPRRECPKPRASTPCSLATSISAGQSCASRGLASGSTAEVARRYGFANPGRFITTYRRRFSGAVGDGQARLTD
jgi:hypothetical protein